LNVAVSILPLGTANFTVDIMVYQRNFYNLIYI
jgi:hypothetical protein